ncbi:thiamine pyrophosphokinase [Cadophora sp. DSE1049]|nr:thiamine pyrophosphokinase [Cadophora sp. DSE1049]
MAALSSIDLLKDCDRFPHAQDNNELYLSKVNSYYHLRVASDPATLGFVLPFVAEIFATQPGWECDSKSTPKTLTLVAGSDVLSRSAAVAESLASIRSAKKFEVLTGWRDESKDVFGPDGEVIFTIERSATPLLGVVHYGVYLTAYTRTADNQLKLWIARRSKSKSTYPGLLEVIISGGISAGEKPLETAIREAGEEASLPEDFLRTHAKATGMISYIEVREESAGGETGLIQPEAHFVYDCELPEDMVPQLNDDEVDSFRLWTVDEVRKGLQRGEFKPGLAHVILHFLVRHGIVNENNDPDYVELIQRLHRHLEFPLRRGRTASKV